MKTTEQLYNVVWMGRISRRRKILSRNLTEADAQALVKSFPNSMVSIVFYEKSRSKR